MGRGRQGELLCSRAGNLTHAQYYFRDVVKSGEPILKEKPGVADVEIVAHQVFDLFHKRNQFMKASLDHWNATISRTTTGRPIDAIIAPIAADPPSPHGSLFYHGYTGFCNWLDYAASTFPVTKVIPEVDVAVDAHEFRCERDRYAFENCEYLECLGVFSALEGWVNRIGTSLLTDI